MNEIDNRVWLEKLLGMPTTQYYSVTTRTGRIETSGTRRNIERWLGHPPTNEKIVDTPAQCETNVETVSTTVSTLRHQARASRYSRHGISVLMDLAGSAGFI